jgi:hypothetical protein
MIARATSKTNQRDISVFMPTEENSHLGLLAPTWRTEPERDVLRLHGLLYYRQQLFAHLRQFELVAHGDAKVGQHLLRVIATAIEAAINHILDGPAQRLEERRDR